MPNDNSNWIGQTVRQIGGIPELIGRVGTVTEIFEDELGTLHCVMVDSESREWWCPSGMLEVVASVTDNSFLCS